MTNEAHVFPPHLVHGTYLDLWIVPHHLEDGSFGSQIPLNVDKLAYQAVQMASIDVDSNPPM